VVFLEEPLRLTLRERVCLLGKVALEFNPVARASCCVLYLTVQPYGWIQKFCRHEVGCHFPYDFRDYNKSLDLMQAPEPIFLKFR
jgi:hypothetical protein